jgi:4-diphosphocytidyl-2-C-methyl-D-erythritol kinase
LFANPKNSHIAKTFPKSPGKTNFTLNTASMILFPNAKINLGLHVLSKRTDNYHNLETLMHPVGLCDILEFLPSTEAETRFTLSGVPVSGNLEENLVYKAYLLLKERYPLPRLRIHLHKMIPSGAGLGGGSSDAAFMLKGLNEMFSLRLSVDALHCFAADLGSDCSFFIENVPALVSGKGEKLTPVINYIKNYKLLLFFPGFPVSTAEAYRGVIPSSEKDSLSSVLEKDISFWKKNLKNDFEKSVFEKFPELGRLKEKLYEYGADYASLSGSGSAVYGLFNKTFKTPAELKKNLIWEGLTSPDPSKCLR